MWGYYLIMYSVCAKNIFRNQPECEAEGHFRGIFSDLTKVQNANIMEYFTSLVQFSLEFSRMGLWLKGFLHDCPTAVALSSPPPCTYTNTNLHCRQCEKHVYVCISQGNSTARKDNYGSLQFLHILVYYIGSRWLLRQKCIFLKGLMFTI